MQIKYLAQGNNILLPGFKPSTSVSKSDILANRPICSYSQLVKDLGVTFDPKLNFNHHIYEITHKATKILGILKRTFLFLNKKKHFYYYINP